MRGKRQGAFTAQLVETLPDPVSDRDCDGRISLLEATIEASRRMTKEMITQSPVAAGRAAEIALLSAGRVAAGEREQGTLHALLVCLRKYKMVGVDLPGPVNDIASVAKLLAQKERRTFPRVELAALEDAKAERLVVILDF